MGTWSINPTSSKTAGQLGGLDPFWIEPSMKQPTLELAQKQVESFNIAMLPEFSDNQNQLPRVTPPDFTTEEVESALRKYSDKQTGAIHFAGHGAFDDKIESVPVFKLQYTRQLSSNQLNGAFDVLAGLYAVPNAREIKRFLSHHRRLRELLFGALPRIKALFGNDMRPELLLIEDMEDDLQRLKVTITSNRADARQALERFDEDWWLDHIQFSQGLLDFTLRTE